MANGIYVGMAGATARLDQLDSIADNLANADSAGFKAERPAFESFLPTGQTTGPQAPVAVSTALDLREGLQKATGRPLDVIPENGAFLSVSLGDGTVGYTRDGQITVGAEGVLMAAGHPVLDAQGQPIPVPPGEQVTLSAEGAVTVKNTQLAQLGTFKLSGPLDRLGPSVIGVSAGGTALPASGHVRTGALELSNVTPIESMVQMIGAQRQYDASMQAIQIYKTMGSRAGQLGTLQE
jgi:flagellar basal-body rod protein FlgF